MRLEVDQVASGVHQARTRYVAWVIVEDGGEVTLIDSGWPGDRGRVVASLERVGHSAADVSAILLTHGHPDHQGSAAWFQDHHDVPVSFHEAERANALGTRVEEIPIPTVLRMSWRPDVLVWGLGSIRLGALTRRRLERGGSFSDGPLDVPGRPVCVHTPGHTSGHAAFHLPSRGALVAGDALMTKHPVSTRASGVQLMPDYFNHDPPQAAASLERLRSLAADVVVTGHGPPYHGTPASAVDEALSHRARSPGWPA